MGIKICPKCQGKVSDSRSDCPHCGYVFEEQNICPDCGEPIPEGATTCPVCGRVLEEKPINESQPQEAQKPNAEEPKAKPAAKQGAVECPFCGSTDATDIGGSFLMCNVCHNRFANDDGEYVERTDFPSTVGEPEFEEPGVPLDSDEREKRNKKAAGQSDAANRAGGSKWPIVFTVFSFLFFVAAVVLCSVMPLGENKYVWELYTGYGVIGAAAPLLILLIIKLIRVGQKKTATFDKVLSILILLFFIGTSAVVFCTLIECCFYDSYYSHDIGESLTQIFLLQGFIFSYFSFIFESRSNKDISYQSNPLFVIVLVLATMMVWVGFALIGVSPAGYEGSYGSSSTFYGVYQSVILIDFFMSFLLLGIASVLSLVRFAIVRKKILNIVLDVLIIGLMVASVILYNATSFRTSLGGELYTIFGYVAAGLFGAMIVCDIISIFVKPKEKIRNTEKKSKPKWLVPVIIVGSIVLASGGAMGALVPTVIGPSIKYKDAMQAFDEGRYDYAMELFDKLMDIDYEDSYEQYYIAMGAKYIKKYVSDQRQGDYASYGDLRSGIDYVVCHGTVNIYYQNIDNNYGTYEETLHNRAEMDMSTFENGPRHIEGYYFSSWKLTSYYFSSDHHYLYMTLTPVLNLSYNVVYAYASYGGAVSFHSDTIDDQSSLSLDGKHFYYGEKVTLYAFQDSSYYYFDRWIFVDDYGYITPNSNTITYGTNSISFTMPDGPVEVGAIFEHI